MYVYIHMRGSIVCSEGKGRRFGKLAGDNGRIDVEYRWIFFNFYNYGFERFGRYDF